MSSQRKLYFIGSSQANRLYKSAIKNEKLKEIFLIINCTKPGACYQKVPFPDFTKINKDDFVIFQLFGNDLMERHIQITKKKKKKTIHLLRFVPESDEKILYIFHDLKKRLFQVQFTYFLIDNPSRHLNCCKKHKFKGLRSFHDKQNKNLKKVFGEHLLSHQQLIGPYRKVRKKYFSYFEDTVHFKAHIYDHLLNSLFTKKILTLSGP